MAASVLIMLAAEPLLAQTSSAQIWPTKRVQVIVPFSPGSATDLLPRTVFEHVAAKVGQTFIIENRPGGGGAMGVSAVAKADPDGYTVLVHSNALVTAPAIQSMPYDPVQDFAGITPLGNVPLVLVISPDKNIKTLKELVAAAKAKPGSINYAAAGIGTPPHLTTERFRLAAQFEGQVVPFKGAPEALTEVLTGRVDFYFCPIVPAMPFIRDGKLLALAVSSSKRASALPDVPTTVEAGFPNSDFDFWIGHCCSHAPGDREWPARSVSKGEARQAGRRGDDHEAGGFRRADRPRGSHRGEPRQGRRHCPEMILENRKSG
jgi:tripartite-type tricarboxylate transporter receptor subunit TctC